MKHKGKYINRRGNEQKDDWDIMAEGIRR